MRNCLKTAKRFTAIILVLIMCVTLLPVLPVRAEYTVVPTVELENRKAFSIKYVDDSNYSTDTSKGLGYSNAFGGAYSWRSVTKIVIDPTSNKGEAYFRRYVTVNDKQLNSLSTDDRAKAEYVIRQLRSSSNTSCTGTLSVQYKPKKEDWSKYNLGWLVMGKLYYMIDNLKWDGPQFLVEQYKPDETEEFIPTTVKRIHRIGFEYNEVKYNENGDWLLKGTADAASYTVEGNTDGNEWACGLGLKSVSKSPVLSYRLGTDNFSFKNETDNFSFSQNESSDYAPAFGRRDGNAMKKELAESMLNSPSLSVAQKAALKKQLSADFVGFCYGMGITSGKLYKGELKRSEIDSSADTTYNMKKPIENNYLQQIIVFYNVLRNAKMLEYKYWPKDSNPKDVARDFIANLEEELLNDSTFMLTLESPKANEVSHAVLAYDLKIDADGTNTVYCYDPNKVSDPLIITISSDFSNVTYSNSEFNGYRIYSYNKIESGNELFVNYSESFNKVKLEMDEQHAVIKSQMDDVNILLDDLLIDIDEGKIKSLANGISEDDVFVKGNTSEKGETPEGIAFVPYNGEEAIEVALNKTDAENNGTIEIYTGDSLLYAENLGENARVMIHPKERGKRTGFKVINAGSVFKTRISLADGKCMPKGMDSVAIESTGKELEVTLDEETKEVEIVPGSTEDEITIIPTELSGGYEVISDIICDGPIIYSRSNGRTVLRNKAGNEIINAKPKDSKAVIQFDGNGADNEAMDDLYVVATSSMKLPENQYKKRGYVFAGWNTEMAGTGNSYANQADISELVKDMTGQTITLYAQWADVKHTIKFDPNGGSGSMESQIVQGSALEGVKLSKCTYTKEGNSFKGWKQKLNGTEVFYDDETLLTDIEFPVTTKTSVSITLYARWEINPETHQHSIDTDWTYDKNSHWNACLNDGDSTRFNEAEHTYGDWVTDVPATVLAAGKKHRTCSVCEYEQTETIPKLAPDAKQYTIVYDGNGATSGTMDDQLMTYGAGTLLTENAFEKTGYKFAGWNTKKDGSGTAYEDKADGSSLISGTEETITLYAQWTVESTGGGNNGGSSGDDNGGGTSGDNGGSGGSDGDNGGGSSSGGGAGNTGNGGNNGGNVGDTGNTGDTGNSGNTGAEDSKPVNNTKPVASNDGSKVTTTSKGEATVTEVKKTNSKSITVSSTTMVDGVKYNVTTINAYAFKNATKAKTVTLPNTITKIKANAFASSKIEIVKLTIKKGGKLTIDKKAFKKSRVKKVQVTMNKKATKKEKDAVIKALKKAGISKKNIKIKLK